MLDKVLQQFAELVHHLLLMLHERVNVAVKGYGWILMTEYLGKRFHVHSAFQGASRKGVPERMKALVRYSEIFLQRSKSALVRSDRYRFFAIRYDVYRVAFLFSFTEQRHKLFRERDCSDGGLCFRYICYSPEYAVLILSVMAGLVHS